MAQPTARLVFWIELRRLAYLDFMRGIAVLIMIPCHTFNAFTQLELRKTGAYVYSQFVGGMAAPLFLFLAGVTFAFQMEKVDRGKERRLRRLATMARRAGYIILLAYLFRASAMVTTSLTLHWPTLWRVDILNAMGVGLLLLSPAVLWPAATRPQFLALTGVAIIAVTPFLRELVPPDWAIPQIRNYLVPDPARFPLFPWSAYLAWGAATGTILRRTPAEALDRAMLWGCAAGSVMTWGGLSVSNFSFSLYPAVSFWIDSPVLIVIRTGLMLLTLAASYLWTEYLVRPGMGWVQAFGKTSLLVYWVHVMLVYGALGLPWKRTLTIPQATAVTALVIVLMVVLSYARLWQKDWAARRAAGQPA